jgi:hypothetical protein
MRRQMIGEPCHVCLRVLMVVRSYKSVLETLAAHRTNSLLAILPIALETGYSEVEPELEPLKVQ